MVLVWMNASTEPGLRQLPLVIREYCNVSNWSKRCCIFGGVDVITRKLIVDFVV